ncbi:dipeptide epimerase [Stratiformator vulcanicus]|uniref:Dipeptide epimerase n=1 Tax=Stratiformator vulcanicus TaxID=2527980 RepID=A0A517R417_9PLAN|nr:dipeptide epimerase [Stratiformator vulcanicus]QDT38628.1 L-Ala-D/L-Glu epimerase [Stratiformator vulcanicus]
MRLRSLKAFHLRIPLKKKIGHAGYVRRENDTLIVRAELSDGTVGWGEGLPRPYVTGESIDDAWSMLPEINVKPLTGDFESLADAIGQVDLIELPVAPPGRRDCFGNSVRSAIEIAFLDAACRCFNVPFSAVTQAHSVTEPIRTSVDEVRYSIVITAMNRWKECVNPLLYRLYGFKQCKLKLGLPGVDDIDSLQRVRRWIGPSIDIRVDANEAWDVAYLAPHLNALGESGISAVEQPVPHDQIAGLRKIRGQTEVPIMLDESLCSESDGRRAIDDGLCDVFNIRLSKCGGILRSHRLAVLAHRAGLSYQLGCMVGETGILSAAGRHFATSVGGIRYLEGSFDRYLVKTPLVNENLTFGRGGIAPALNAPGLGVTVDESAIHLAARRSYGFTV